ncbi:MAG: hypothetical protein WAZ12_04865 [Candidatus Absconditicoccaceae bacterium]
MRKLIYIVFFGLFLILFGCVRNVTTSVDDKDINTNEKIMVIQQKLINGEITQEQAQEMTQNIGNYSIEDISNTKKFVEAIKIAGLPDRAKNLGLVEPLGMSLDQDISKITSIDNDTEGFDSVILVYKGDYLKSVEEAARIAQLASIPVSKEFQQAKEIEKESPDIMNQMGDDIKNSMKGIIYTNNDLTDINVEYLISISVDQDGTLTINASNYKQMKEAMKNSK